LAKEREKEEKTSFDDPTQQTSQTMIPNVKLY